MATHDPATLLGQSLGGYVAPGVAARAPGLVTKLILANTRAPRHRAAKISRQAGIDAGPAKFHADLDTLERYQRSLAPPAPPTR